MTGLIVLVISFLVAAFLGKPYIRMLNRAKMGQHIREDGPNSHLEKTGTPTMGGGIFLIPILLIGLFFIEFENKSILFLYVIVAAFAAIGGIDDYLKFIKRQNEGLTSKQKFLAQLVSSFVIMIGYMMFGGGTTLWIPGLDVDVELGLFYLVLTVFMLVGTSNATNLTDGLDGLLAGNAIVTFLGFGLVAQMQGHQNLMLFAFVIVGALAGFLLFNFNPAKVFMGDMGSLALGGLMVGFAIILHIELLLVLFGFIYVIETLSVILQVSSYKWKQKRIFKMAPIHHHFEYSGHHEKNIFVSFIMIQLIATMLGIILL